MALVECPECTHRVSDQARVCPECAYPLRTPQPSEAVVQRRGSGWTVFVVLLLAAAGVTAFVTYGANHPARVRVGDEVVLSAHAGTFVSLASSTDDLQRLLSDLNNGAVINMGVALTRYSVLPVAVGTRVKVLEVGRAGDFGAARVQEIDTPAIMGWTAADWLDPAGTLEATPTPRVP